MTVVLSMALVVGLVVLGIGIWLEDTTMVQGLVLGALVLAVLACRWPSLSRRGIWEGVFYFLSGAGIGMLAYHGDVSILLVAVWIALSFWIERGLREDVQPLFGTE